METATGDRLIRAGFPVGAFQKGPAERVGELTAGHTGPVWSGVRP